MNCDFSSLYQDGTIQSATVVGRRKTLDFTNVPVVD